jgi:hypothetical protein
LNSLKKLHSSPEPVRKQISALQPLKKLAQALDLALAAAVELLVGLQEVTRSPHDHLDLQFFKVRDGPSLYMEI